MEDPGPLDGDDLTAARGSSGAFGVTTGRSRDGTPTVEFTSDPVAHGPHGRVRVTRAAPMERRLFVRVRLPDQGWATCQSDDSVRVWGRFAPDVEVELRSAETVRIVVRTPAGAVLAGPALMPPEANAPAVLQW